MDLNLRRKESAFILAQVVITLAVLALVSIPAVSRLSTNDGSVVFSSGVSPDGLQLEMALNSTAMRVNGSIGGHVSVVNTLGTDVTVVVPEPSQKMSDWSRYTNICPTSNFEGYAVFIGRYSADNISLAGEPLTLVPPMILNCVIPYYVPGPLTFSPHGGPSGQTVVYAQSPSSTKEDRLLITTLFCNTTESGPQSFSCSWASPGLVGYWEGGPGSPANFGFTSPGFARFFPGVYTIMAWDVWDQYVFARVVVTSAVR